MLFLLSNTYTLENPIKRRQNASLGKFDQSNAVSSKTHEHSRLFLSSVVKFLNKFLRRLIVYFSPMPGTANTCEQDMKKRVRNNLRASQ